VIVLLSAAVIAVGAAVFVPWWVMLRMPGESYGGPLPPLTAEEAAGRARLEAHVVALAGRIGERHYARPEALEAAALYVEDELRALGYEVRRQAYRANGQDFRNLEVTVPGGARADEVVVVGGHYDSVVGTPGADDNATGVAGVLELARHFRGRRPARTLRLVAFVNEEPPFFLSDAMGSRVYAREAKRRGDRVAAMLSLETIGYFDDASGSQQYPPPLGSFFPDRGDFIGFVGNVASASLVRRCVGAFRAAVRFPSEGVAAPAQIPGVYWSDHDSFWKEGWPAVMITDTAPFRNPHYHGASDTPRTVDFDRLARVVRGIAAAVDELLGEEGAAPTAGA